MPQVEYSKPVPVPDALSEGFWQAARDHRLEIQRCQHCGYFCHPPAVACPNCRNPEPSFAFERVSGLGAIKTWTVMRDSFLPGFHEDIPWVIAIVELVEQPGLRLLATLLDGADAPIRVGAPVEVVFQDVTPAVTLPQFRLRAATEAER